MGNQTSCDNINDNNNIIISIDGNIGSGKSTLLKNLKEFYKDNKKIIFLKEPVDEWNEIKDENGITIIEKFYSDRKKYAFPFQMMAYISRYKILNEELEKNKDCILITERSIYTDKLVFARMLYETKDIDEISYKIYNQWFDTLSKNLKIDKLVYVDAKPEICQERIIKRNRDGENEISIDYLNKCEIYHQFMVSKKCDDCICHNQLILDGSLDIYEDENNKNKMIEQVDDFINKN